MPTGIEASVVSPATFAPRGSAGTEQTQPPRERNAAATPTGASSESIQSGSERALLRAPDAPVENRAPAPEATTGRNTNPPAAQQVRPQTSGVSPEVGGNLDVFV